MKKLHVHKYIKLINFLNKKQKCVSLNFNNVINKAQNKDIHNYQNSIKIEVLNNGVEQNDKINNDNKNNGKNDGKNNYFFPNGGKGRKHTSLLTDPKYKNNDLVIKINYKTHEEMGKFDSIQFGKLKNNNLKEAEFKLKKAIMFMNPNTKIDSEFSKNESQNAKQQRHDCEKYKSMYINNNIENYSNVIKKNRVDIFNNLENVKKLKYCEYFASNNINRNNSEEIPKTENINCINKEIDENKIKSNNVNGNNNKYNETNCEEFETCAKVKITKENIINMNEIKKIENDENINQEKKIEHNESENNMKNDEIGENSIKNDENNKTNEKTTKKNNKCLYPHEIVEYLNKYIIGQSEAKKVVANALRQRWRRTQLDDDMKKDVIPKNILMIGPTGVGKTEIARRISMFIDAPFIKVEATKFTEVGFHGKDVDQIIKDLVEIAVKRQKSKMENEIKEQAEETVDNIILYSLLGNSIKYEEKQIWKKYLKEGLLDDKIINIDIPSYINNNNNMFTNDSVENAVKEALSNHQNIKSVKIIHQNMNKQNDKRTMTIKEAKQKLLQIEIDSSINQDVILKTAINSVEEEGIVFIDEIDKICSKSSSSYNGPDASAEGVQRDLLPLIEGCVINTKYGNINTNYILFIASGAFQRVKPNDMLNELQGRLPVHVNLSSLSIQDFIEILTKTHNNLLKQNIALLKTEGIDLNFTDDAIESIANAAHDMNTHIENIGVRRLHTIIEKIMEEINYDVHKNANKSIVIDKEVVKKSLEGFIKQFDLKKYII
ncbi:ATP-dependent protease ATPase subunit ClpY, putative [Plasmodium berghei]|uniref:ATP-dependent protease ATPase subunit ClpY, putative n=2 Tax=Plasmodium berghei TaxID=5821 RepID=A0A509AIR9_PLABA|nr:ATP-dependent protease ATPase subunit ClpY, putative [Plasmodium berghei ANKA]CXI30598.1 ATP-dependent protease ATPase subunit ClpY, putative [Plasmodium berghei]SCM20882.1 ATP-dependent protease ATPase subunit ClpY, putative [Plasmodium berghei]SCN24367.1 ATP-dependent protease ATPase subunit ClpY, putative [Plasmodium berghei]SCO59540.1 ATP-dependent protease ATPase subunit ClpY, putative [Plasmodium berghei]SCO60758.1 ATP-dependent protease ATPase subunit ClpY, putative [Plasmodium bergh|eukprot:XP_034421060.1 ATP-dependent protease ATPase subunit ClpY, putative [Plasmodium berghei ANKA]